MLADIVRCKSSSDELTWNVIATTRQISWVYHFFRRFVFHANTKRCESAERRLWRRFRVFINSFPLLFLPPSFLPWCICSYVFFLPHSFGFCLQPVVLPLIRSLCLSSCLLMLVCVLSFLLIFFIVHILISYTVHFIAETVRTRCRHWYTMVHDSLNVWSAMDLKILVEVNTDGEFVGPNAIRLKSFLSSLAHQPRHMSLIILMGASSFGIKRRGLASYFGDNKNSMQSALILIRERETQETYSFIS